MNIELENLIDLFTAEIKMIRRAALNVTDCLLTVEQRLAKIRMILDADE